MSFDAGFNDLNANVIAIIETPIPRWLIYSNAANAKHGQFQTRNKKEREKKSAKEEKKNVTAIRVFQNLSKAI